METEDKKTTEPTPKSVLPFPLDIDTLHTLKKGGFVLLGQATLAAGTATVLDRRIKASSISIAQYANIAGTIGVALEAICTDGQIVLTSYDAASATEASDTSIVSFVVFL